MASEDSESYEYPGLNLPLRHLDQRGRHGVDYYRLGSFEGANNSQSELLQVREVAMMILQDRLTDKPNWHEKVFDETIVAKWRNEALTKSEDDIHREIVAGKEVSKPTRTRIITEAAFDYCIAELRCKAAHFEKKGLVFTLNSTGISSLHNTAIKSDSVVSDELRQGLKAAFEKLQGEQADQPDWHPGTDNTVQDLVHPSMYPFIYGKSKFIQDEVVGVAGAVDKWSGKGEVVPEPRPDPGNADRPHGGDAYDQGYSIDRSYWSKTYQWLPANLEFQEDDTVRFTSYINNLHPKKHPEIYRLVEKLIDTAIPAWNRVLSSTPVDEDGKTQKRFGMPDPVDWEDRDKAWEKFNPDVLAAYEAKNGPVKYDQEAVGYLSDDEEEKKMPKDEGDGSQLGPKAARKIQRLKWREISDALFPEPLEFKPVTYKVGKSLREKFKDIGLQVIVKMASIELTPEKPDFPIGGWHIEGQMNEHIVATALYYLDSENVTPSHLSFRMATSEDQEELQEQVGQDMYHGYEQIYGTKLSFSGENSSTVQTYGSVGTPEGRLLAFPNVFQHRVSSFSLQDRTKPGHRRFIALWLVDPFTRIVSTANVPPQQLDWWAEAVFGSEGKATKGDMPPELFQLLLEKGAHKAVKPTEEMLKSMSNRLPVEVMDMVRKEGAVPEGLMTYEDACEHRLALMAERSAFVSKNEEEWGREYSFCEH